MKKKKTFLFLVLIALMTIMSFCIFMFFKNKAERLEVNSLIEMSIVNYENGTKQYIDFAGINDFSWDKVFIFGPYSNCDNIASESNLFGLWPICKLSGIENYEGSSLIVFSDRSQIIRFTLYSGIAPDENNSYDQNEAKFIFNENGLMVSTGN